MEQRVYSGNISPEQLADFLVRYYDPQDNLQAQQFGQGESIVVQIAHGDVPEDKRHAVTVAIARSKDDPKDLMVTMGQQQWITPQMAGYAAMMGLISALVTPWALFALIWPVTDLVQSTMLPRDIWHTIENFTLEQGVTMKTSETLSHPHKS